MRKALFILCVLISAGCCVYTAAWLFEGQRQRNAGQALAERFQPDPAEEIPGAAEEHSGPFDALLELNADVVGWIRIDGTSINHPVVQRDDNEYYLSRNIHKEPDQHGAIFLDYRCDWESGKVIYGHHMKDGTMFRDLARYQDEAFRREHETILLYGLLGDCEAYQVVDVLYWEPAVSPSDPSLYEYLNRLMGEAPDGPQLYLTTCDNSNAAARFVVAARRLSGTEAEQNTSPRFR